MGIKKSAMSKENKYDSEDCTEYGIESNGIAPGDGERNE